MNTIAKVSVYDGRHKFKWSEYHKLPILRSLHSLQTGCVCAVLFTVKTYKKEQKNKPQINRNVVQQNASLNIQSVDAQFDAAFIVPDLLPSFDPVALLSVSYSGKDLAPGTPLSVDGAFRHFL